MNILFGKCINLIISTFVDIDSQRIKWENLSFLKVKFGQDLIS